MKSFSQRQLNDCHAVKMASNRVKETEQENISQLNEAEIWNRMTKQRMIENNGNINI